MLSNLYSKYIKLILLFWCSVEQQFFLNKRMSFKNVRFFQTKFSVNNTSKFNKLHQSEQFNVLKNVTQESPTCSVD